ncbi:MAG TPA: glycine cleavage system protein GcvH [Rectinemataceae bacterium]|nr:glycine cleavage system protein GcvH [Rectinemataceae bacterium]
MKLDSAARYQSSHEFARKEGNVYVIGLSDHAQEALGDIVYVELPEVGKTFAKGGTFGVVESVKAASDLYLPIGGKVVATNAALGGDPALLNRDCYGEGWLVKIEATDAAEFNALMDAATYEREAGKE